jgi:beta-lactamase regulating signal transducer with metallopeptidase domain
MNESINALGRTLTLNGGSILLQLTIFLIVGLIAASRLKAYGPILQTHFYKVLTVGVIALVGFMARGGGSPTPTRFVIPAPVFESRPFFHPEVAGLSPQTARPAAVAAVSVPTVAKAVQATPINPLAVVAIIWLLGSLLLFGKLFAAQVRLALLKRRAENLTGSEIGALTLNFSRDLGVKCPQVCESAEVSGPFLAGVFRPTIFLPAEGMATEDLEIALRHELSHLKANDCLWGAVREILCIAFWPQPLVWRLSASARQAAEEAVDRQLLLLGLNETDYANCLLRLVATQKGLQLDLGIGVAESKSSVSRRIEKVIANAGRSVKSVPTSAQAGFALSALLLAFVASGLIAFGQSTQARRGQSQAYQWVPPRGYEAQFSLLTSISSDVKPAILQTMNKLPNVAPLSSQVAVPPKLSGDVVQEVNKVNDLGQHLTRFSLAQPDFPLSPNSPIPGLLTYLVSHPQSFYTEFELAIAYRREGRNADAEHYQMDSLKHAPVVLAGQVRLADGRPAANRQFKLDLSFFVEQDRVAEELALTTDNNGCYYAPTWRAPLGSVDLQLPHASVSETISETLPPCRIIPDSKVVLVPWSVVRPRIQLLVPYRQDPRDRNLETQSGSYFNLKWQTYPGASYYRFIVLATDQLPNRGRTEDQIMRRRVVKEWDRFTRTAFETVSSPRLSKLTINTEWNCHLPGTGSGWH